MPTKNKPLLRWTVGNISKLGREILEHSINSVKNHYPEFDLIVCHNSPVDVSVQTIDQTMFTKMFHCPPASCSWKLYPPRLRKDCHEIFIDNDIVLNGKIPALDQFLDSEKTLVCEARRRLYGRFENRVPQDLLINGGIFGLPPKYPFEIKIREFIKNHKSWDGFFDEQGVVASLLHGGITIPLTQLNILTQDSDMDFKCAAAHFCGANRTENHKAWDQFKKCMFL